MGNELGRWYENFTYQKLKGFIDSNIRCMAINDKAVNFYIRLKSSGESR